jgi:proline iminopeptidase
MPAVYPEIEPYAHGTLDVGDPKSIYWEQCGNPHGKPAVVLHGGPGSGCTPWHRRLFDPHAYRIILFDQRNCGRSTPHAAAPSLDLSHNTTAHLVADIERLREHLQIDRWLVLGGSWGSTLALAYAEAHPQRVSEMILFGVTTGRYEEADWTFRGGLARLFPAEWARLLDHLRPADRNGDIVEAYRRLLHDPDPAVCQRAAEAWCLWESATPDWAPTTDLAKRFQDPVYALAFARIVTHYVIFEESHASKGKGESPWPWIGA